MAGAKNGSIWVLGLTGGIACGKKLGVDVSGGAGRAYNRCGSHKPCGDCAWRRGVARD